MELGKKKAPEDGGNRRDCLQFLVTKEFHGMELDEALLILETRWLQAEARVSHLLRSREEERRRSAERQAKLQEQLDAARKELGEMPLLRDQLRMHQQVAAQAKAAAAAAEVDATAA